MTTNAMIVAEELQCDLEQGSVLQLAGAEARERENPADEGILGKKFLTLSENVLGKTRAQKSIDVILSVERMSSLKDLLNAIAR